MKGLKRLSIILIVGFFFITASIAYSSGTPALDFYIAGSSSAIPLNVVVVSKYDSASYTYAEAEAISQAVSKLIGLGSTLAGSLGLSTAGLSHFTPSQVAAWGITDADILKNLVKTYYQSWGFNFYAFADIKRVTSVAPELGHAMRIDIWIADLPVLLGLTGDYLYIASLEIPETYLTLLGSIF